MKYRLVQRAADDDFVVFAADITADAIPDIILKLPPSHVDRAVQEIDVEWVLGEEDVAPGVIPEPVITEG